MTLPIIPHQRHQKQADHNYQLLKENIFPDPCGNKNVDYKDWNITILFYTALHYVQAYLSKNSSSLGYRTEFGSHHDRNNYLARISMTDHLLAKVVEDYITLCNASFLARYNPCRYYYIQQKEVCQFAIFALQSLPNTLGLI